MRKILVLTFIISILFCQISFAAFKTPDSARWEFLGDNKQIECWIDMDKLLFTKEDIGTVANVWVLVHVKKDDTSESYNWRINLSNKEWKVLSRTIYDENGKVKRSFNASKNFEKIPYHTFGDSVYESVQDIYNSINSRPDKEQIFAELRSKNSVTQDYDSIAREKSAAREKAAPAPPKPSSPNPKPSPSKQNNSNKSSTDSGSGEVWVIILLLVGGIYYLKWRKKANQYADNTASATSATNSTENNEPTPDDDIVLANYINGLYATGSIRNIVGDSVSGNSGNSVFDEAVSSSVLTSYMVNFHCSTEFLYMVFEETEDSPAKGMVFRAIKRLNSDNSLIYVAIVYYTYLYGYAKLKNYGSLVYDTISTSQDAFYKTYISVFRKFDKQNIVNMSRIIWANLKYDNIETDLAKILTKYAACAYEPELNFDSILKLVTIYTSGWAKKNMQKAYLEVDRIQQVYNSQSGQ